MIFSNASLNRVQRCRVARVLGGCIGLWALFAVSLPVQSQQQFILSSPPWKSAQESREIYEPIAQYLSTVVGFAITYRRPDNWLSYRDALHNDSYDIVFDDPHFVSYRIEHYGHTPLVKIPGEVIFAVLGRKNDQEITEYRDLAGRTLCGQGPPHLGTLRFLQRLENPLRQPILLPTASWRESYAATLDGRCHAGIVPMEVLARVDKNQVRVLYLTDSTPGPAFTAGRRVSEFTREQIVAALTTWEARQPTRKMRAQYDANAYVIADAEEYQGLHELLDSVWGRPGPILELGMSPDMSPRLTLHALSGLVAPFPPVSSVRTLDYRSRRGQHVLP